MAGFLGVFIMISIHALRGEGDTNALSFAKSFNISIHALRGEGDFYNNRHNKNL